MRALPDITSDIHSETPGTLNWVGMENIAVPINLQHGEGKVAATASKVNLLVSLDEPDTKGIHMSRLYIAANQLAKLDCNADNINRLLENMVSSQQGISQQAKIELQFDIVLEKPALLSQESGFQAYPTVIRAEKNRAGISYELELTIPYSSTCPCSASLSRQLVAEAVDERFQGDSIDKNQLLQWLQSQAGSIATPHSQRSFAYIRLSLANTEWPDLPALIQQLEQVIGTPLQTAVKRIDEQEFARLNATNLMFCEDAARRIKLALERMPAIGDYWFKVEHQESLHAHNAVAIDQKFPSP